MVSTEELNIRIREILKDADLEQTTSRKIRNQLEEEFKVDLTDRKAEIDEIVFNAMESLTQDGELEQEQTNEVNPEPHDILEDLDEDELEHEDRPLKSKKEKKSKKLKDVMMSDEEDDAADLEFQQGETDEEYAKRLQRAEQTQRLRQTRSRRPAGKRQVRRGGPDHRPKRPASDKGINAPMMLSDSLADLVGTPELSRPQVVKKIWEHVREKSLQDPDDRRFIMCDEQLQAVFGKPRIHSFTMNKLLSEHMKKKSDVIP